MKLLKITAAILVISIPANAVTIEKDAVFGCFNGFEEKHRDSIADASANLIRGYGYRCDSISSIRKFLLSNGFNVKCNNYSYAYELEDRGGTWVVTLK